MRGYRALLVGSLVAVLVAAGPFLSVASPYLLHLMVLCLINLIAVQGLNLLSGYVGDLNLGYGAFVGLSAYTTALLTLRGVSPWLGLLAAIAVSLLFGWLSGLLIMRLRGSYFIMVTFALQLVFYEVVLNWTSFTRGSEGLINLPTPSLFGLHFDDKLAWYFLALAGAMVVVAFCYALAHSSIGEAWVCTRENRALAEALGIKSVHYNMVAHLAGAIPAGIGGWLLAHYITVANPQMLALGYVITLILMMTIGGRGTIVGPIIGALLITLLPEQLRLLADWRLPMYGVLLVIISVFLPWGIMQFLGPISVRLGKLRRPARSQKRAET
ncbi:MAG: branched-chain amino acid ABC transporter permease [Actinobacteria bacterium]|nr:branched-chain amino acid ABC transporter permease [Actinomycetota bacterium]